MTQPTDDIITHNLPNLAGSAVINPEPVRRTGGWRLLVKGPVNKICIGIVAAYLLVGLLTLLPQFEQFAMAKYNFNAESNAVKPSWTYINENHHVVHSPAAWFGTDFSGHSVFWRTLYGTRTALLITVLTSALVLGIGSVMGITAGYFGGWVDDIITWIYAVLGTIPWMLLVIAVNYVLKQNASLASAEPDSTGWFATNFRRILPSDIIIVILSLGLTDWVNLCRLVRGEVIKLRDSDMVAAGRALGLSQFRILFRHILPNVSHIIIITFTIGAVGYLQVEVILAFLGLGVTSKPSWGRMIDDAKLSLLRGDWWEVTAATIAIFIICMALNLLGDALRDALDPKLRGRD
jgi:ABC-type dipeptide/oligopeptide/nickel transport system permease subunit